jgi:uncharacterized membrane protein
MKKENKPSNMRGSWIGLGVYLLMAIVGMIAIYTCNGFLCEIFPLIIITFPLIFINYIIQADMEGGFLFVILIMQAVLYFYIGWGIHSLIRRLRK